MSFPRPVLQRIEQESGGNPLFALELGRALRDSGLRPGPGEPLPLDHGFRELLAARSAQLQPSAREALLAVALMAHPTDALVERVVGHTGELDADWLVKEIRKDATIGQTRIILLVSRLTDEEDGAADGIAGVERLLKPVRQSAVYDCLSATIHAKSPAADTLSEAAADAPPFFARILIAEDNPVNREVASEALRQLG